MSAEFDPCRKQPCNNGATCGVDGKWYKCHCSPDFTGQHCDGKSSICAHLPVKWLFTGVICERLTSRFSCVWPECVLGNSIKERHCGTLLVNMDSDGGLASSCKSNDHAIQGSLSRSNIDGVFDTCTFSIVFFICCWLPVDFARVLPDYDPCQNKPCLNGGHCQKERSTYTCLCLKDYFGTACERKCVAINRHCSWSV